MKPLLSPSEDPNSLQTIGRASLQIVHDLKNQLNGLKLYATFLRKRMEKREHPPDEMETVNKLIAGLDRAAADLSTILDYGRPVELRKQSQIDLQKIMRSVAASLAERTRATGALTGSLIIEATESPLLGEFDPAALSDALKSISLGALKFSQSTANGAVKVSLREQGQTQVSIDWLDITELQHDPFNSFVGSLEIRMCLAARIIEAHGGSVGYGANAISVKLPLT
jgi:light-regulated signal transduction histidine kinase (bacteriophytochrome)